MSNKYFISLSMIQWTGTVSSTLGTESYLTSDVLYELPIYQFIPLSFHFALLASSRSDPCLTLTAAKWS